MGQTKIRRHQKRNGNQQPKVRLKPAQQAERDKLIDVERDRIAKERPASQ